MKNLTRFDRILHFIVGFAFAFIAHAPIHKDLVIVGGVGLGIAKELIDKYAPNNSKIRVQLFSKTKSKFDAYDATATALGVLLGVFVANKIFY
ncbi:MAG: hypothetical protein ACPGRW_06115 [Flavobacteriaceae bacterium]